MLQVFSPFELTVLRPHRPVVTGNHRFGSDRRSGVADEPLVVDWETLDQGVWTVVKALKLLPPEVLEASLAIPFPKELQTQKTDSVVCSQLCDPNLSMMKRKQPEHLLGGRAGAPDALA